MKNSNCDIYRKSGT